MLCIVLTATQNQAAVYFLLKFPYCLGKGDFSVKCAYLKRRMAFCGWHGKFTLHLLVNKQETAAIRNLLELPGTPEQGSGRKRHREETVTEQQTPNQLKSNTVSNAMS